MKIGPRNSLARLTSLSVGTLLLAAGCLKLYGLSVSPVPRLGWFAWPEVQLLVSQWELLLGLWLVSGWGRFSAWLAALLTFLAFAGVSAHLGWVGVASCGCFGKMKASPWAAFGVDIGLVATLAALGRPRQAQAPSGPAREFPAILAPGPSIVIIGAAIFAGVSAWGLFRYGSLHLALARLNGERLTIDEPYLDLGRVRPGEVIERSVVVRNWSDGEIRIVGAPESCACYLRTKLPAVVPPGGRLAVPVWVVAPRSGSGAFTHPVSIWTDCGYRPVVKLEIGGLLDHESTEQ